MKALKHWTAVIVCFLSVSIATAQLYEIRYTVKPGDNLYGIARNYGVNYQQILSWNGLSSASLQPGQRLLIYANGTSVYGVNNAVPQSNFRSIPAVASTPQFQPFTQSVASTSQIDRSRPIEYMVRRGETLSSIARGFGLSVKELKAANDIKGDKIKAGESIVIPPVYSAPAVVNNNQNVMRVIPSNQSNVVLVNPGYNVQNTQVRSVPAQQAQMTSVTVGKGQTLYALAQKYNSTEDDIKAANNLRGTTIKVGQILWVPINSKMMRF